MRSYFSPAAFGENILRELEDALEGEAGEKLSYKWWVSLSSGFGEGYELVPSLSTREEQHTADGALFRHSAVIQMAFKTLKKSRRSGTIKVERFVQKGSSWKLDENGCSKADLSRPSLRIVGCWP